MSVELAAPRDEPVGWAIVPVGTVLRRLQYGTAVKCSTAPTGTPVLRIPNVVGGVVDHRDMKYGPLSAKELASFTLEPGDLLMIRSNGSVGLVGRTAIVGPSERGFAFAGYLMRLEVDRTLVTPEFLHLALQTYDARVQIEQPARSTSGVHNINSEEVKNIRVPLAPLPEQRRVVEKVATLLEQVNRAKGRLERVPLILKRFRQAVLAAACSGELTREWRETRRTPLRPRNLADLLGRRRALWEQRNPAGARARRHPAPFEPGTPDVDLPEGWSWVSVSHLALLDVGFAFKSAEFEGSGIRLLRGENVEPGSLRWLETRYWSKSKLDEFRHLLVEPGEIILAMDRPIVSAGLKIARVKPNDVPALLVQRVMRFKMLDVADTDYLYWCLSHHRFIDFLAHDGMTGSDLPHITGTGVAEFPIPVPPPEEQVEIVAKIERLFTLADAIQRRVEAGRSRAENLPQAILSKAFSGELVPTEAELARVERRTYETAEELLARTSGQPQVRADAEGARARRRQRKVGT